MKPYLESVRRLSRTGLVLFVLSVVASIVVSMQFCISQNNNMLLSLSRMFVPLMVYTFVGGIVMAFDGFSFLTKRADSDSTIGRASSVLMWPAEWSLMMPSSMVTRLQRKATSVGRMSRFAPAASMGARPV